MKHKAMATVYLVIIVAVHCGPENASLASRPETPSSSPLVDPGWLEQHINDPGVRVIEMAQSEAQYAKGHIPGAVFVHWVRDVTDPAKKDRYNVAGKEMMQALLGKLGVRPSTTIVLYDDLDNRLSTRMFWTLRYYGHNEIRLLDGGRKAWARAVTYCNEGLHAAPPWFVLTELLGYSHVKLYDDSMAEWANTPDVPIVSETD